ncbi:MAG: TonB-dependent receptor, partial [Odoribacter sp.]|nr:TonB-dependent receptor [Odoribacter sp.]
MNADGSIKHLIPEGGYIDETRSDKNSYTLRAQINFNRTFDEKHEVSAIAGGERRAVHSTSTYVEKYGYDKVSLAHKYLDEATLNQTQQGTEAINNSYTHVPNGYPDTFGDKEDRYVSFYGNASYTYDRRYAITGSIRMDQSNLFGTNPKYQYKPLWSVGVSWHMAQEKFMGNMDWLDQLSIRFTKGINGNIAKQSGPYMIVYSAGINSWTGEYSSSVSSPPNSGLRWERTNQTNLGIDFSFFNNRLGGSFDYYAKNTSDLLGSIATDPTSGWGSLTMNYAEMYNHGYEIVLNSVNIQTRDFRWATNINFSYNKNRITKLENSSNSVSSYISGTNTREGMAMGTLFSVRWAGLDESGNPQAYKKDGTIVKSLADLTVEDLVRSGTSIPPYSASMSNMLTYKGFDLSFMFLYYGGHVMRDVMPKYFTSTTGTTNVDRSIRNYWKSPEDSDDPDKAPAFMRNASTNYTYLWYAADKHIKKANYIKLKEVTLS